MGDGVKRRPLTHPSATCRDRKGIREKAGKATSTEAYIIPNGYYSSIIVRRKMNMVINKYRVKMYTSQCTDLTDFSSASEITLSIHITFTN
jgi:hypothetical protein